MNAQTLVALMLVAGLCHASWNLLTKAGAADRMLVIASLSAVIALLALPWAVLHPPSSWWPLLPVVVVRALAQCVYAMGLSRAYASTDFSLAYPLARGTGLLVAVVLGVVLLAERPRPLGLAGVALVRLGIVSLALLDGRPRSAGDPNAGSVAGIGWALLTGVTIGVYTVIDKVGVSPADALT